MYAVVSTGGKQYRVAAGDKITVEKIDGDVGTSIELDKVFLIVDGEQITVGRPNVDGAKVVAKVTGHGRGRKVVVFKKKKRKNYRRWIGHRQAHTELEVEQIICK